MLRHLLPVFVLLLVACTDAPASDSEQGPPMVAVSDTTTADAETMAAFERVMTTARTEAFSERPFGAIVQSVGEVLIGARYQDGLLDVSAEETLVVDLTAFDCVLYVENVLALARGIAQENYSFAGYVANLEDLRYRNGTLDGYCSRLHYFTDWMYDNALREHVTNITRDIGGEALPKTLDFMTTHRGAYARLVSDSTFACILGMEEHILGRDLFYVPQDRIEAVYDQFEAGDVIATATHIGGLDVTHTGFVHRTEGGGIGFLHASSTGEVKVADDLAAYIRSNDVQIGIIVARPVDPRSEQ